MSLKVLLLEDDESLTRELEHALAQSAHEVTTSGDPERGFGLAASKRFDVVLVSNGLSDGDGFFLSERIKSDPATAGVPLVIMSKPVVVSDLLASLPGGRASLAPSGDLRDTIKNQARTVATLRADLASRGKTIDGLTKQVKELTQRLTETLSLLEKEEKVRADTAIELEAFKAAFAGRIAELEAAKAAEVADRERAHAEEMEFLERAQQDAVEAASKRLHDSERNLTVERATHVADYEARAFEMATFRDLITNLERERDAAIAERDDARTQVETIAMDVAQAQIDLAETTRGRTADAQTHVVRLAELESALAARITELENALATEKAMSEERFAGQEQRLGGTYTLEAELATEKAKVTELTRALEAGEREAIQAQLARDAAFHDMNVRAAADLAAAIKAAKAEANADREELLRAHEHAIKLARDKAIGQALAVARERKKQT